MYHTLWINEDVVESGLSYTEFWNEMNTNKRHYSDATNFKDAIIMSKEMVDKGYVNSSFLSDTYDMAQTALAEGTAGMYCNGTWVYDEIASKYPESADKLDPLSYLCMRRIIPALPCPVPLL